MTTLAELEERWSRRRLEHQRLGSMVRADEIIADLLADFHELRVSTDAITLSLKDAATETGYHPGSIARMIKSKKVRNYGTVHRPRVRVAELPRKARAASCQDRAADGVIALDAVTSRLNRPRSA